MIRPAAEPRPHGRLARIRGQIITFSLLLSAVGSLCYGQSGLLLSRRDGRTEWESVLTLDEMTLDIRINNQFATVNVRQIFANPVQNVSEGRYVFALPASAAVSAFAVWDGDTRIPGVILEKRRAEEIYETLLRQAIDPGILKQDTEEGPEAAFTVRVTPIPAYGYKRLELAYTETLAVDSLQSRFSYPFRPTEYGRQRAGHLRIDVSVTSDVAISRFTQESQQCALTIDRQSENEILAHFEGRNIEFGEDFAFLYSLGDSSSRLDIITHRAPERVRTWEIRDPGHVSRTPDGYFQATATFNEAGMEPGQAASPPPRVVTFMLDTSLSMQWEKLQRAYEALEYFIRRLTPRDRFNLLLFNDDVRAVSDTPLSPDEATIERVLQFVRSSYLSGGTDFLEAFDRAIQGTVVRGREEAMLVMISDGNPTLGTTQSRRILQHFRQVSRNRVRAYVFGIGTDVNSIFLEELARISRGHFASVRQTDDIRFSLRQFWGKVGSEPVTDLSLNPAQKDTFQSVYSDVSRSAYDGTQFAFVGRYRIPLKNLTVRLRGAHPSGEIRLSTTVDLPDRQEGNDHLPRVWARARVDALLRQIELEGESTEAIDEIIEHSRRFNFVTPYTAFLAAPRALLRPRVIRPGDPVLRVRTDPSIRSVVAVFPFGLVKPLMHLSEEDLWETRFLAPASMDDGQYVCRLILTSANGQVFEEPRTFTVDSRPPRLRAQLSHTVAHAGDELLITVNADRDTRRLTARLYGAEPVPIIWNATAKASVGRMRIPGALPSGMYTITIFAEDFAHNSSSIELPLEIIGGYR